MKYLTGATNDKDEPALLAAGIGLMCQPGNSYHLRIGRYRTWGADNGCFSDKWAEDPWLAWLDRLPRDECLFAVAPDVYPDAAATLGRSVRYFGLIREMGFPVALVAQDHAERLVLPWDDFDVLFVGGKKQRHEWKLSEAAESLTRRARNHGKWVHMGRVNSLGRLERARSMGCDSADGTFLKYRRRRLLGESDTARDGRGARELADWAAWLHANPTLPAFSTFEGHSLAVHRAAK